MLEPISNASVDQNAALLAEIFMPPSHDELISDGLNADKAADSAACGTNCGAGCAGGCGGSR